MADHNANKITVRVQVEPTPGAAETSNQQSTAAAEACADAQRTQPEEATPDAAASGLPMPPTLLTTTGDHRELSWPSYNRSSWMTTSWI